MVFLLGAAGAGRALGREARGAGESLWLRPITIPFLSGAGAALGFAGSPVWPTTKLSLSFGTGTATASAPTTTLGAGGGGGTGSSWKKVAPICLPSGLGCTSCGMEDTSALVL